MAFDADDLAMFCDPDMPRYAQATVGSSVVEGRLRVDYHDGLGLVAAKRQVFSGPIDELSAVTEDDSIVIAGSTYVVREVQTPAPDAPHHTALVLEAA